MSRFFSTFFEYAGYTNISPSFRTSPATSPWERRGTILMVVLTLLCLGLQNATAQTVSRTITGNVTTTTFAGGIAPVSGVSITASTDGNTSIVGTTQTDVSGNYRLVVTVPAASNVLVLKASRTAWQFAPDTIRIPLTVPPVDTTISGKSFQALTNSMTGKVTLAATVATTTIPFSSIVLTLKAADGTVLTTTNAVIQAGNNRQAAYQFNSIPTSGTYSVEASLNGVSNNIPRVRFDPARVIVAIPGTSTVDFTVTPVFPLLRGRVVANGFGLANVSVSAQLTGAITPYTLTTRTNSSGYYSFSIETTGTWTVTTSTPNYTTVPLQMITSVDITKDGAQLADFIATVERWTLSGNIRASDDGTGFFPTQLPTVLVQQVAGTGVVTVKDTSIQATLNGTSGQQSLYTYRIDVPNGIYKLTATLTDFSFITSGSLRLLSATTTATVNSAAFVIAPDVRATPTLFTISGEVGGMLINWTDGKQQAYRPVQGIPMIIQATETGRIFKRDTITNANGLYSFSVPKGDYRIGVNTNEYFHDNDIFITKLSKDSVINFKNLSSKQPKQAFGSIYYKNGIIAIPDVSIRVIQTLNDIISTATITTAADGRFFFNVTSGAIYTLEPSLEGHVFDPLKQTFFFNPPSSSTSNDYRVPGFLSTLAPIVVTGTLRTIPGLPFGNTAATISVTGQEAVHPTTTGTYSVILVGKLPGEEIMLSPVLQGYNFAPRTRTVIATTATSRGVASVGKTQILVENQDYRVLTTTAGIPLATISGSVLRTSASSTTGYVGVPDVAISDGTRLAITGADGRYSIRGVPNGSYTVTAFSPRWAILASTRTIRVENLKPSEADVTFGAIGTNSLNQPPVINRLVGNGTIYAQAGRVSTFQATAFQPFFVDPERDQLHYTVTIEDPTIIHARASDDNLTVEPLTAGNTILRVTALDTQGALTTATYRVVVGPQPDEPTSLLPINEGLNTNFNAPIIITRGALTQFAVYATTKAAADGNLLSVGCATPGDELGAFNANDECVGSVRLSGGDDVLTIWSEEPESGIKGLKPKEQPTYSINRRGTGVRVVFIQGVPLPWPIDRAVIGKIQCTETDIASGIQTTDVTLNAYPNPASGRISVEYSLPTPSATTLELFNIFGQKVLTLVREMQSVGRYTVSADVQDVPPGIYVCRLQSGTAVTTIKLSITR